MQIASGEPWRFGASLISGTGYGIGVRGRRLRREAAVFAYGDEHSEPKEQGHDDSAVRCSWCKCGPGECALREGR